jgi:hypothetical protein
MNTREIAHDQWAPFLNEFSQAHRGERVEVRVMGGELGEQAEASGLPLVGITDDFKAADGERIEVMAGEAREQGLGGLGNGGDAHVSHSIIHPIHVRIAEQEDGTPVAVQIESEDGTSTLVRFLPPGQDQPPEMLGT